MRNRYNIFYFFFFIITFFPDKNYADEVTLNINYVSINNQDDDAFAVEKMIIEFVKNKNVSLDQIKEFNYKYFPDLYNNIIYL